MRKLDNLPSTPRVQLETHHTESLFTFTKRVVARILTAVFVAGFIIGFYLGGQVH